MINTFRDVVSKADRRHLQSGLLLEGLATTTPEAAPGTFAPFAPMLLRTPCSAMGLSVAMKLSIAARLAFCKEGVGSAQHDESMPAPNVKILGIDSIIIRPNNIVL